MVANASRRRSLSRGFTLIELLVVVAIIALLISILLPSLSKARSQARTTLCASRIAQLAKAMLIYADDYEGSPPFVAIGFEWVYKPDRTHDKLDPDHSEGWYWERETWCVPGFPDICYEPDWTALDPVPSTRDGSLFSYTRFENLYRCPEFERIPVGTASQVFAGVVKTQNVFNYTRTVLGRKLVSTIVDDPLASDELDPGPVMKVSSIYNPAAMFMLLDEQWDFHCAGNYDDTGNLPLAGFPMAAETVHGLIGDMVGSYHGVKSDPINHPDVDFIREAQRGNVAYYDGHVALYHDPFPWRTVKPGSNPLDLIAKLVSDFTDTPQGPTVKALDPFFMSIYAQRGLSLTQQQIIDFLLGVQ